MRAYLKMGWGGDAVLFTECLHEEKVGLCAFALASKMFETHGLLPSPFGQQGQHAGHFCLAKTFYFVVKINVHGAKVRKKYENVRAEFEI